MRKMNSKIKVSSDTKEKENDERNSNSKSNSKSKLNPKFRNQSLKVIFVITAFITTSFFSGCFLKRVIEKAFLEKDLLEHPPAKRCGDCHKDIFDEWRKSRHAIAWESEDFIRRSKKRTDMDCLPCHAPVTVWGTKYEQNEKAKSENKSENKKEEEEKSQEADEMIERILVEEVSLRDFHLEDGVYCVSCHFWDGESGTSDVSDIGIPEGEKESKNKNKGKRKSEFHKKGMVAQYDVWSPPHPSFKDERILSSEFCGVCHEKTFKEWMETGVRETCQDCHMPTVGKKYLTQKPPVSWFHSKKGTHSHEFPSLIAEKKDIEVEVEKSDGKIIIFVKNKGVPHNLPTADFGKPLLYIDAEYKGKKETFMLSPHTENALKFNTKAEFIIEEETENEEKIEGDTQKENKEKEKIKVKISRKLSWKDEEEKIGEWEF